MSAGITGARVSNTLLAQLGIRGINRNMQQLLELQHQLASGLRLYKTSVDPGAAAVTMAFQTTITRREQTINNIARSNEFLVSTDNAMADLQDLLNEAANIASTNIGAATDDTSRQNAATVVGSLISQLAQLANRQYAGRYLFAGRSTDEAPFDLSSTRVRFTGDLLDLSTFIDRSRSIAYNLTAQEAFGTLSGQVTSLHDLNPAITAATSLADLNGGTGVRLGTLTLSDGVTSTQVDLSQCVTVGQIIGTINSNGVVSVTAGINAAQNGLVIQGDPGDTISVQDLPGGNVARDLGILQATPLPPGTDLVGADLDRILTTMTELGALMGGAGFDQASGLSIAIGEETVAIDLSAAGTVEDLLNALNYSGLDLRAGIADDGRRITVANAVASENMYIGENGGTTAEDLGIRSMHAGVMLSALNNNLGVRTVDGKDDLEIHCRDGTVFTVDLSGASTVQDVLDAINGAAGNPGVTASLNVVGNGIRLVDTTVGADDFTVARANSSFAAADLGIEKSVANPGDELNGDDVAPVVEQGVFHHLFALRDALLANDSAGISRSGAAIQDEVNRVARVRGTVGVRMQMLDRSKQRIEDEILQMQGLLSEVRDLDYAAAVTRFQTLQTTFEASLQTTASVLPLSLMDFLKL